jgi:hypothetical protein
VATERYFIIDGSTGNDTLCSQQQAYASEQYRRYWKNVDSKKLFSTTLSGGIDESQAIYKLSFARSRIRLIPVLAEAFFFDRCVADPQRQDESTVQK